MSAAAKAMIKKLQRDNNQAQKEIASLKNIIQEKDRAVQAKLKASAAQSPKGSSRSSKVPSAEAKAIVESALKKTKVVLFER